MEFILFVVLVCATPFSELSALLPMEKSGQVLVGLIAMNWVFRNVKTRNALWMLAGFILAGNVWAVLR